MYINVYNLSLYIKENCS